MTPTHTVSFTHRIVKRFITIVVEGKKKKVKSEKLYLDFTVVSQFNTLATTRNYTAHVYSDGKNKPEIRVKDPSGDSRDIDKAVSRTIPGFIINNRWLGNQMGPIISTIENAHAEKLAKSIARWEEKRALAA